MKSAAYAIGLALCLGMLALHSAACGGEAVDEQSPPTAVEEQSIVEGLPPGVQPMSVEDLMTPPPMSEDKSESNDQRTMSCACPGGLWKQSRANYSFCHACGYRRRHKVQFERWCHCENCQQKCGGWFYAYSTCIGC